MYVLLFPYYNILVRGYSVGEDSHFIRLPKITFSHTSQVIVPKSKI